ncbi:MAG: flagellar hook-length control protein FliK [Thiobacillus sp.]|nr:flagellar hook-length control protein FliK [Thiobacillus sp.]
MFPTRALSQVLAVPPALDSLERDQAGPRAAFDHLKIGQTLTGLVKGQSNGISLVEVGGQTVTMRLPSSVGNGDTLKLRFSGHMPQPVFMLEAPETAAKDGPELSKTARMLSDIMQRVPERALPTLMPAGPLLNQATVVPAELALALRTALVRSGLFYESHLANWVAGQDTLVDLMQEPQNRQAAESLRSTAIALALADAKITADPKLLNPMHTLLTQQLQVLESPQLAWRGELWPGHTLEWQIKQGIESQPDDANGTPAEEDEAGWESHLKLTLPRLGTLNVSIKLDANQAFSIRMMPENADTAPLLQRNQVQLVEQLAAAGCALQSMKVEHDAST